MKKFIVGLFVIGGLSVCSGQTYPANALFKHKKAAKAHKPAKTKKVKKALGPTFPPPVGQDLVQK